MSSKLTRSPILATAVIVGLVAATALVAGLVDRPGAEDKATCVQSKCNDCPKADTPGCCKAKEEAGSVSVAALMADVDAQTETTDGSACSAKKAGACASEAKAGCSGGGCGGGGCGGGGCAIE